MLVNEIRSDVNRDKFSATYVVCWSTSSAFEV